MGWQGVESGGKGRSRGTAVKTVGCEEAPEELTAELRPEHQGGVGSVEISKRSI